jgi:hypothetical protein
MTMYHTNDSKKRRRKRVQGGSTKQTTGSSFYFPISTTSPTRFGRQAMIVLSVLVALVAGWVPTPSTRTISRRKSTSLARPPLKRRRHVHIDTVLSSKDCNYVNNPLALSQKESLTDVMANSNNNKVYHSDQPQQREQKLPRSERKALERQKKVDRRKQPQVQLHAQAPQNHTSIQLHSNAASQFNEPRRIIIIMIYASLPNF